MTGKGQLRELNTGSGVRQEKVRDSESQGVLEQLGDSCLVLVRQAEAGGGQISLESTLNSRRSE